MKRICSLLLTLALLLGLAACGQKPLTWQEQYDLGVKYLSEGNYEEAVIAFTAAIEIDPKKPEAYQKAAEAYAALGDLEAARDILEQGYAATENPALSSESALRASAATWAYKDLITPQELTVGGTPFYLLGVEGVEAAYPGSLFSQSVDGPVYITNNLHCTQNFEEEVIYLFDLYNKPFDAEPHPGLIEPEFRNLKMGDSFETALEKLGFTPQGIQFIQDNLETLDAIEFGYLGEPLSNGQDYFAHPVSWIKDMGEDTDIMLRLAWLENEEIHLCLYIKDGRVRRVSMERPASF